MAHHVFAPDVDGEGYDLDALYLARTPTEYGIVIEQGCYWKLFSPTEEGDV